MKDTSRLQVQVGQFLEISSRMGHPMGFEQEGVKTALLDPKSRVFSYHGKENKCPNELDLLFNNVNVI